MKFWTEDPHWGRNSRETVSVDTSDATVRKLYGPNGEVLATFSDRPPTGFHQGARGEERRR